MARRAVSPRHGLITGLGPVSVPIFTHAGRRSRGTDDSYVLSRAWTIFRWPISLGLVDEDCEGMGGCWAADRTGTGHSRRRASS
jgi:hypothetical protein